MVSIPYIYSLDLNLNREAQAFCVELLPQGDPVDIVPEHDPNYFGR